jgi:hypothetical protein
MRSSRGYEAAPVDTGGICRQRVYACGIRSWNQQQLATRCTEVIALQYLAERSLSRTTAYELYSRLDISNSLKVSTSRTSATNEEEVTTHKHEGEKKSLYIKTTTHPHAAKAFKRRFKERATYERSLMVCGFRNRYLFSCSIFLSRRVFSIEGI